MSSTQGMFHALKGPWLLVLAGARIRRVRSDTEDGIVWWLNHAHGVDYHGFEQAHRDTLRRRTRTGLCVAAALGLTVLVTVLTGSLLPLVLGPVCWLLARR